jgi:hypothetical protein
VEEVAEWGKKKGRLSLIAGHGGKKGRGTGGVGDVEAEAFFSRALAAENISSSVRWQLEIFPLPLPAENNIFQCLIFYHSFLILEKFILYIP